MSPGRSSDSLQAVLLSAKSQSGSGSKPGSSAVTWHSLKSVGPMGAPDPPGHYFPAKLALSLGLVKIFFSLLMMGLGAVAIVMKASISSIGAGVWVGVIVGVSGFLGVCAAKRPYIPVYVISFMSVSILALAASGLLIVLSATAWARDGQTPQIILYDKETQSEVDLFGEFLVRRPSILVSGLLVVLGVFDILISLACVALSAREACGTHSTPMGVFATHDGHDKKERLYRWLGQQKNIFQSSTASGSKNITSVSQFVPLTSSGETSPFRKHSSSPLSPSSEPLLQHLQKSSKKSSPGPTGKPGVSSGNSSDATNEKRGSKTSDVSKTTIGVSSEKKNSSVLFIHPEVDYNFKEPFLIKRREKTKPPAPQELYSLPPLMPTNEHRVRCREGNLYASHWPHHPHYAPLHHQETYVQGSQHHFFHSLHSSQHQLYAQHPTMYYHPINPLMVTPYPFVKQKYSANENARELNKLYRRNERKREKKREKKEAKRKRREEREQRKDKPLTDKQIENSYTGLDREIAEGFISLAMEPAASKRKSHHSMSDHESF